MMFRIPRRGECDHPWLGTTDIDQGMSLCSIAFKNVFHLVCLHWCCRKSIRSNRHCVFSHI